MASIRWLVHSWAPQGVPDEHLYYTFRLYDQTKLKEFLKQERKKLRTKLHAENPYQWKPVWIISAVGAVMMLLERVTPSGFAGGIGLYVGDIGAIVLVMAGVRAFSTVSSRSYGKAYRAQRRFYTACWQASKQHDYAGFYAVVKATWL